jgi:hypothetical protein
MSRIFEEHVDLIFRVTFWFFSMLTKFILSEAEAARLSETSECSHWPARLKHPKQDLLEKPEDLQFCLVHCVWHNKCGSTEELLIAAAFMSSLCWGLSHCVLSIAAAFMFSLLGTFPVCAVHCCSSHTLTL